MKSLKIKNQNYNAKFKNNFDIFYLSFFILIFTFYILTLSLEASASTINKSPNYLGSSNGLVGYWTMDGNSVNWATGAVTDSSGRGNTGTITNMATSTAIGKIGQALNFDGSNDYVELGDKFAGIVTTTGTYSISALIYPTNALGTVINISPGGSTSDRNGIILNNGAVRAGYWNGVAYTGKSKAINLNTWYYIVLVNTA